MTDPGALGNLLTVAAMNRVRLDSHLTVCRAWFIYALLTAPFRSRGLSTAIIRPLTPEQQEKWTDDSLRYPADSAK